MPRFFLHAKNDFVGNGLCAVPYGFAQHPAHRQITSSLTAV